MNITRNRNQDVFLKTAVEVITIPKHPDIQRGRHVTRLEYAENSQGQKYNYDELVAILGGILRSGIYPYINRDAQRPFLWQVSVINLPGEHIADIVDAVQETAKDIRLGTQYEQLSRSNNTYLVDFEICARQGGDSIASGNESQSAHSGSTEKKAS